MQPAAATVDTVAVVFTLVFIMFLEAWGIWWLEDLLQQGCPECPHCQDRNRRKREEEERLRREFEKSWLNRDDE